MHREKLENKLKEREHLQVEIVKLNTEKLVNGLKEQFQNELVSMQKNIESLGNEVSQLLDVNKKIIEMMDQQEETINERVTTLIKRVKILEQYKRKQKNRSLWQRIKGE